MKHDKCRNTARYKTAGQNLALFMSSPNHRPIKDTITEAITMWYNEYKYVPNLKEVNKLGSSGGSFSKIGHWNQLMQSKANRIGCSVVQFTKTGWKQPLIGCNYSAGNLRQKQMYTIGEPASLCKTGRHSKYPGLCSMNENYLLHKNADWYFNKNAAVSPVVQEWLRMGKKLIL